MIFYGKVFDEANERYYGYYYGNIYYKGYY